MRVVSRTDTSTRVSPRSPVSHGSGRVSLRTGSTRGPGATNGNSNRPCRVGAHRVAAVQVDRHADRACLARPPATRCGWRPGTRRPRCFRPRPAADRPGAPRDSPRGPRSAASGIRSARRSSRRRRSGGGASGSIGSDQRPAGHTNRGRCPPEPSSRISCQVRLTLALDVRSPLPWRSMLAFPLSVAFAVIGALSESATPLRRACGLRPGLHSRLSGLC